VRFGAGESIGNKDVVALLDGFLGSGLDFIRTEQLYNFAGVPGYSEAKG